MKNKIIKICKTILIMGLLSSFLLPSYASLSASDGSAFVTKGEFDSALADFNARLTTFEAGINSKIDSQVTSYLDRNGIWSAKKQTTQNLEFTFKELNEGTVAWMKKTIFNRGTSYLMKEGVVINEVDKNGLCYMEAYWDNSWSCSYFNDRSKHCSFEGAGRGNLTFGQYLYNDATGKYDIWKPYVSVTGLTTLVGTNYCDNAYYTTASEKSKVVSQFFVRKKDKVYVDYEITWGGRTDGGGATTGSITCQGAGTTINNSRVSNTSTTKIKLKFDAKVF